MSSKKDLTRYIIFPTGTTRKNGAVIYSNKFHWSDKHQQHIWQARELEADEFNEVFEKLQTEFLGAHSGIRRFLTVRIVQADPPSDREVADEKALERTQLKEAKLKEKAAQEEEELQRMIDAEEKETATTT